MERYKAKKYKEGGRLTHTIHASYGKTLFFECKIENDEKIYTLVLKNRNEKVVFEANIKEDDMLQLAKSMDMAKAIFNEQP